tara:strand:+ start:253 stop:618 length:366 start_codon:yes stop_codon:yes gene_type:complete
MANQELQYRVLKLLEENPDLTQRQIAEKLGVSLGKTHYLIKSLSEIGWIKFGNFKKSDNKWGYAYLLTPKGISEKASITIKFLERKQIEYMRLHEEITELKEEVGQLKILKKKRSYKDQNS